MSALLASACEILRPKPGTVVSGWLPSTGGAGTSDGVSIGGVALPIYAALMLAGMDDGGQRSFALANGKCDGFTTRAARVSTDELTGLAANPRTDTEILYGFGLETPFVAGDMGTIMKAWSLVLEGDQYILSSGTGALDDDTAVDTKLSFKNGLWYEAQTGDQAQYRVVAQLTPVVGGACRLQVEEIEGYKV